MSLLDRFKTFGADLVDQVKKFANKDFMEAACATSTLIAAADGSIDPEEKMKTLEYMKMNDSLKVFSQADVIKSFNEYTDLYAFDAGMGKDKCFATISKIKNNPDAARACLRLGCVIGAADGDFDNDEKAMVRQIAGILGLNANDFID